MGSRFFLAHPQNTQNSLTGNKSISRTWGKGKSSSNKNALLGGYVSLLEIEPGGRGRLKGPFHLPTKNRTSGNKLAINSLLVLGEGVFPTISHPAKNWLVVSKILYFHRYLGKWSNLTIIFQMDWNHQLEEWCKQRVKKLLRLSLSGVPTSYPNPPLHAVKNSVERGESSSSYIYPLVKLEVTKGCPCRTSWHRCIWSTSLDCKSYIWQLEKIHILWMDIVCVSPQADQVDWHQ